MDAQYQFLLSKLLVFQDKIQALTEEVEGVRSELATERGARVALEEKLRDLDQAQSQARQTPWHPPAQAGQPRPHMMWPTPAPGWAPHMGVRPAQVPWAPHAHMKGWQAPPSFGQRGRSGPTDQSYAYYRKIFSSLTVGGNIATQCADLANRLDDPGKQELVMSAAMDRVVEEPGLAVAVASVLASLGSGFPPMRMVMLQVLQGEFRAHTHTGSPLAPAALLTYLCLVWPADQHLGVWMVQTLLEGEPVDEPRYSLAADILLVLGGELEKSHPSEYAQCKAQLAEARSQGDFLHMPSAWTGKAGEATAPTTPSGTDATSDSSDTTPDLATRMASLVEMVTPGSFDQESLEGLQVVAQQLAGDADARSAFCSTALARVAEDQDAAPSIALLTAHFNSHSGNEQDSLRKDVLKKLKEAFQKGFNPESTAAARQEQQGSVALIAHLYLVGCVTPKSILIIARTLVQTESFTTDHFNLAADLLFATSEKLKKSAAADDFAECEIEVMSMGSAHNHRRESAGWATQNCSLAHLQQPGEP